MSTQPIASGSANNTAANAANIITALGAAFKTREGEPLSGEKIAQLLLQNMGQLSELAKQGKLNQQQIMQLKEYADKHNKHNGPPAPPPSAPTPAPPVAPTPPPPTPVPPATTPTTSAFKASTNTGPFLTATASNDVYPISSTVAPTTTTPVQWAAAQQGRPTLTGGIPSGRISGTPVAVAKNSDESVEDTRVRRKNSPGDQSMRRSIQDLVSSIDPNVKIEGEVEDLLLDIADEFIDSVTNFGCRLAKHRGGDTLEIKDLQLHLERNHNIRIPGFASDETRISVSQIGIAPAANAAPANKKGAQSSATSVRGNRLAQVAAAKRQGTT